MKSSFFTWPARWLMGGLLLLAAVFLLTNVDISSAHDQDSSQPDFVGVAQSSPDEQASIVSKETRLDGRYFAAHGQVEGLALQADGFSLAPGATVGVYTSAAIQSPLGYTTDIVPLWGVEVPDGGAAQIETRLSTDQGGTWSAWLNAPAAFFPVRENLHSGHLIWVGGEQVALQVRVTLRSGVGGLSPRFNSLILAFNDTSQGPTDGQIAGQMARLSAAAVSCPVEKPTVVSRTAWGCPDGQNSPRRPPVYAPVTHIVIHQTETPNNTAPYQDYAGWVRSVWNYHANVLRWGDVGYNYLIDPNGTIYEGRAGGDDVVGIHDGRNRGSMAIGFLGCYGGCDDPRLSVVEPSEPMLAAAVELMAWKSDQKGLDPLASAPYNGLPSVPVIAGGQDVSWTTSPGDKLYALLPELRTRVDDRANCELAACEITDVLFSKSSYAVGDIIDFTVKLADSDGNPLGGANVVADVTVPQVQTEETDNIDLDDLTGNYDGSFADTTAAGVYEFVFTATDPTGDKFSQCTATRSVSVGASVTPTPTITTTPTVTTTPTATPTPTVTPSSTITTTPTVTTTPTATPTPTPTTSPTPSPTPTGVVLKVSPQSSVLPVCEGNKATLTVGVENVVDLQAVEIYMKYDPAVVQVIDAAPGQTGTQVTTLAPWTSGFQVQNQVLTSSGIISYSAALLGSGRVNGNADVFSIDFEPVAVGSSNVSFSGRILLVNGRNQVLSFTPLNGVIQVSQNCSGSVSGQISLQGRSDHSGIVVTDAQGQQAQTQANGSFTIAGSGPLTFEYPGFLSAQSDPEPAALSQSSDFQTTNLGTITLLAGDVNDDNMIDILDLAYIANKYGSTDGLADLDGSGQVDILDLVLAANNYNVSGPLTNWQ